MMRHHDRKKEIKAFIKANLSSGFKMPRIELMLLKHGYKKKEILEAKGERRRDKVKTGIKVLFILLFSLIILIVFESQIKFLINFLFLLNALLFALLAASLAQKTGKTYNPKNFYGAMNFISIQKMLVIREIIITYIYGPESFFDKKDHGALIMVSVFRFCVTFNIIMLILTPFL